MNVALELFTNKIYYPTSFNKITLNAVIIKRLLYNYFMIEEDILAHLKSIVIEKNEYQLRSEQRWPF